MFRHPKTSSHVVEVIVKQELFMWQLIVIAYKPF